MNVIFVIIIINIVNVINNIFVKYICFRGIYIKRVLIFSFNLFCLKRFEYYVDIDIKIEEDINY